jgi:hypothetical protein
MDLKETNFKLARSMLKTVLAKTFEEDIGAQVTLCYACDATLLVSLLHLVSFTYRPPIWEGAFSVTKEELKERVKTPMSYHDILKPAGNKNTADDSAWFSFLKTAASSNFTQWDLALSKNDLEPLRKALPKSVTSFKVTIPAMSYRLNPMADSQSPVEWEFSTTRIETDVVIASKIQTSLSFKVLCHFKPAETPLTAYIQELQDDSFFKDSKNPNCVLINPAFAGAFYSHLNQTGKLHMKIEWVTAAPPNIFAGLLGDQHALVAELKRNVSRTDNKVQNKSLPGRALLQAAESPFIDKIVKIDASLPLLVDCIDVNADGLYSSRMCGKRVAGLWDVSVGLDDESGVLGSLHITSSWKVVQGPFAHSTNVTASLRGGHLAALSFTLSESQKAASALFDYWVEAEVSSRSFSHEAAPHKDPKLHANIHMFIGDKSGSEKSMDMNGYVWDHVNQGYMNAAGALRMTENGGYSGEISGKRRSSSSANIAEMRMQTSGTYSWPTWGSLDIVLEKAEMHLDGSNVGQTKAALGFTLGSRGRIAVSGEFTDEHGANVFKASENTTWVLPDKPNSNWAMTTLEALSFKGDKWLHLEFGLIKNVEKVVLSSLVQLPEIVNGFQRFQLYTKGSGTVTFTGEDGMSLRLEQVDKASSQQVLVTATGTYGWPTWFSMSVDATQAELLLDGKLIGRATGAVGFTFDSKGRVVVLTEATDVDGGVILKIAQNTTWSLPATLTSDWDVSTLEMLYFEGKEWLHVEAALIKDAKKVAVSSLLKVSGADALKGTGHLNFFGTDGLDVRYEILDASKTSRVLVAATGKMSS